MAVSRLQLRLLLLVATIGLLSTLSSLSRSSSDVSEAWFPEYAHGERHGRDQAPPAPQAPFIAADNPLAVLTTVHDPVGPTAPHDYKHSLRGGYKWATDSRLRALTACAVRGDCPANAHKVAIIAMKFCHLALFDGYNGGEGVWCKGMIGSLERQGYTVLFASNDYDYVYSLYRQFPDLVRIVIGDPEAYGQSYRSILKREKLPDGVPAWKWFYPYYYPNPFTTVVGSKWVIVAEPSDQPVHRFTYTGYELADVSPSIPFAERPHRVYLMAKYGTYFSRERWGYRVAWPDDFYARATAEMKQLWPDFEIVAGIVDGRTKAEKEAEGPMVIPDGITNVGKLNATAFDDMVSSARLLLGVGKPGLSPSPYRALAQGVPFLNPLYAAPHASEAQHNTLRDKATTPQVYNIPAGDYEAFRDAIKAAMETPVEPWRAPWMSREAADERMRDLMERDWRAEAAEILELRKAGNETQNINKDGAGPVGLFDL